MSAIVRTCRLVCQSRTVKFSVVRISRSLFPNRVCIQRITTSCVHFSEDDNSGKDSSKYEVSMEIEKALDDLSTSTSYSEKQSAKMKKDLMKQLQLIKGLSKQQSTRETTQRKEISDDMLRSLGDPESAIQPDPPAERRSSDDMLRSLGDPESAIQPDPPAERRRDTVTIPFDPADHSVTSSIAKTLIGPKGKNLKKMQKKTGTVIQVIRHKDRLTKVKIEADDQHTLSKAVTHVREEIKKAKKLHRKEAGHPRVEVSQTTDSSGEQNVDFGEKRDYVTSMVVQKSHKGKIIGKDGSVIVQLMELSGARIIVSNQTNADGEVRVDIHGSEEACSKARDMLERIINPVSPGLPDLFSGQGPDNTLQMIVPRTDAGRIIGIKGSMVDVLSKESGATILLVDRSNNQSQVNIHGPPEACERAKTLIEELLLSKSNVDGHVQGPNDTTLQMIVSRNDAGKIIGYNGSKIAAFCKESGTLISVVDRPDDESEVNIHGPPEACETATKMIEGFLKAGSHLDGHVQGPNDTTLQMIVSRNDAGKIIGRHGSQRKALSKESGANFWLVNISDDEAQVDIYGPPEACERAKALIEELIIPESNLEDLFPGIWPNTTLKMNVSRTDAGRIIGKHGSKIEALRKESGTLIRLVDSSDDEAQINIHGPPEACERAKTLIEELLKFSSKFDGQEMSSTGPEHHQEKSHEGQMSLENLFQSKPLGIFDQSDLNKVTPRIECEVWDRLEAEDRAVRQQAYSVNEFEEMIRLTEEGKMWKFPINNDDGWAEENVGFHEHVFLDHLIEDFPKKGPIRHFMELVITGLSKNPHLTVQQKHDHIDWFRQYFTEKQDLMVEGLGSLGEMGHAPEQAEIQAH